jgi:hypothetical protein
MVELPDAAMLVEQAFKQTSLHCDCQHAACIRFFSSHGEKKM